MPNEYLENNTLLEDPNNPFEKYLIKNKIAEGGFSFIYDAEKLNYGSLDVNRVSERKDVIIKELYYSEKARRDQNSDKIIWKDENEIDALSAKIKGKTLSEARKLAGLSSPYILYIYNAIEVNNTIYIITKKIDGAEDFGKILNIEKGPVKKMPLKESLKYIRQVCEALIEVHSKNIVHLDIKPENILFDEKTGNAILIDFGISVSLSEKGALTHINAITAHYSPPEQTDKSKISFATDIYALGCTLYVFLTGNLVPKFTDIAIGAENVIAPSYFNNEISSYLDEVILKSINIKIDDRYQTVQDFLEALDSEQQYNALVEKAQELAKSKKHIEAIDVLNQTLHLIPFTEEVTELIEQIRSAYNEDKNKDQILAQIEKADQFVVQKKYENALEILRAVPQSTSISKKILFAESEIKTEKFKILLKEALAYENSGQIELAIEKYLELKLADFNNQKINDKIDSLQLTLDTEQKYKEHFQNAQKYFSAKDYNAAYQEFLLAKNHKPKDVLAAEYISKCLQELEKEKSFEADLEKVLAIEKQENIDQSVLSLLQEFKNKYPNDTYIDKVCSEKNDQFLRIKGIENFNKEDYKTAKINFASVSKKTIDDLFLIEEIDRNDDLQNIEERYKVAGYQRTISYLQGFPNKSKFYNLAQEKIKDFTFLHAQELHEKGKYAEAEQIFLGFDATFSNFWIVEHYLKFYEAIAEVKNNEIEKAKSLFSTITYNGLQADVKSNLQKLNATIILHLEDINLNDAQQYFNQGYLDKAIESINLISSSSNSYADAQLLKKQIEAKLKIQKEEQSNSDLNDARQNFKNGHLDKALESINLISSSSNSYNDAQILKGQIEEKIKIEETKRKGNGGGVTELLEEKKSEIKDNTQPTPKKSYKQYFVIGGLLAAGAVGFLLYNGGGDKTPDSVPDAAVAQVAVIDSTSQETPTEQKVVEAVSPVVKDDSKVQDNHKVKDDSEIKKEELLKKQKEEKRIADQKAKEEKRTADQTARADAEGRQRAENERIAEQNRKKEEESKIDWNTYNKKMSSAKSQINNMNGMQNSADKEIFRKNIVLKLNDALRAKPNDPEAKRLLNQYN